MKKNFGKKQHIPVLNCQRLRIELGFKLNSLDKEGQIKEKIANLSQKQAREKLKEISEIEDVIVDFSPSFLPRARIPKNKDKVTLKIETI